MKDIKKFWIRLRATSDFKKKAIDRADDKGFSNLSEYIRHLIINDIKDGEKNK